MGSTSNMTTSTTTNTTTNSTLKKKIPKKKSINYGQHCDNTLSSKSKMSFIKDKSFFQEKQKKEVSLGCIHGNYVKPSVSNGSIDSHDMLLKHLGNGNFGSYPFSGSGNGNGNGNHVRRIGIAFGSNFFHQFGDHAVSLWDFAMMKMTILLLLAAMMIFPMMMMILLPKIIKTKPKTYFQNVSIPIRYPYGL